jgi:hypothetical protein
VSGDEHAAWERVVSFLPVPADSVAHAAFLHALRQYREAVVNGYRARLKARLERTGAWADHRYDQSGCDYEVAIWREGAHDALGLIDTPDLTGESVATPTTPEGGKTGGPG